MPARYRTGCRQGHRAGPHARHRPAGSFPGCLRRLRGALRQPRKRRPVPAAPHRAGLCLLAPSAAGGGAGAGAGGAGAGAAAVPARRRCLPWRPCRGGQRCGARRPVRVSVAGEGGARSRRDGGRPRPLLGGAGRVTGAAPSPPSGTCCSAVYWGRGAAGGSGPGFTPVALGESQRDRPGCQAAGRGRCRARKALGGAAGDGLRR